MANGNNLLPWEQMLSFKSMPLFGSATSSMEVSKQSHKIVSLEVEGVSISLSFYIFLFQ